LAQQQHAVWWGGQAGDQVQQRGLAAARVADQRDELALLHGQVDVAQRGERPFLVLNTMLGVFDLR
jgi:hypothetical protein